MHTQKLPEELDDSILETYHVALGQPVRAGMPIATLKVDGRPAQVPADADGVVLYHFLSQDDRCGGGVPLVLLGGPGEHLGWDARQVRCVRVMILRKCEECGGSMPINGWAERIKCNACGKAGRQPADFWRSYLAEHVEEARAPRKAAGANVLGGAHGSGSVQCWNTLPLCRSCSMLLPWNAVLEAHGRARPDAPVEIKCLGCGEPHRGRPAPPQALSVLPDLVFLLGETSAEAAVEAAKPVVFSCPSCTASLKIDGEKRIVRCKFCESDVYLPEDLWRHLHPSVRRGRWWLLLRP